MQHGIPLDTEGRIYRTLNPEQKRDFDIAETAVTLCPKLFSDMPIEVRMRPELALIAVRATRELDGVPQLLLDDMDFCALLLREVPCIFPKAQMQHARALPEIALPAVMANHNYYLLIPDFLRSRPEFYRPVLATTPSMLDKVPEPVWEDAEVVAACVRARPYLYTGMPESCPLLGSKDFALEMLARQQGCLRLFPKEVLQNAEIMRAVVRQRPALVHSAHFPCAMKSAEDMQAVLLAALESGPGDVMRPPAHQPVLMPVNNFQSAAHRQLQAAALRVAVQKADFDAVWEQVFPSDGSKRARRALTQLALLELEEHCRGIMRRAIYSRFWLVQRLQLEAHPATQWALALYWVGGCHPRAAENARKTPLAAPHFDLDIRIKIFRLAAAPGPKPFRPQKMNAAEFVASMQNCLL